MLTHLVKFFNDPCIIQIQSLDFLEFSTRLAEEMRKRQTAFEWCVRV